VGWDFHTLALRRNLPDEPAFPSEDVEAVRTTIMEWKEHVWESQTEELDDEAAMQASNHAFRCAGQAC